MAPQENHLIASHLARADLDGFLNDPVEKHAVWFGALAGFRASRRGEPFRLNDVPVEYPDEVRADIRREYHYYLLGWTIGWSAGWAASHWYTQAGIGLVAGFVTRHLMGG